MKGYAECEIFSKRELKLLQTAQALVRRVPGRVQPRRGVRAQWVRCHELARAIGKILKLEVADGWYGFVEHSWLWTSRSQRIDGQHLGPLPNILDLYVPGRLPQVQLVHTSATVGLQYRPGSPRDDINDELVAQLARFTAIP